MMEKFLVYNFSIRFSVDFDGSICRTRKDDFSLESKMTGAGSLHKEPH